MNTSITAFNFEESNEIRTLMSATGEPLFVAKDVALALGYSEPTNAVRQHCEEGGAIYTPLQTAGGMQEVRVIDESDVYSLIFGSKLESAKRFKRWVTSEVLPSIRRTGAYTAPILSKERMEMDVIFAEAAARMLNLSESSKLGMMAKIAAAHSLTSMLPSYTVDAPKSHITAGGSSLVTFSATELLRQNGSPMTAAKFNKLAIAAGYLCEVTRPSRSQGLKKYKAITENGLQFGKNITHPTAPNETQPHYYQSTFTNLLRILNDRV